MLKREDFRQPLYYVNGNPLTGSDGNLRFCIAPVTVDADGNKLKDPVDLMATAWPGPNCLEATAEELKQRNVFPLNEEGLTAAIEWLNTVEV